jgi:hypothetical protein
MKQVPAIYILHIRHVTTNCLFLQLPDLGLQATAAQVSILKRTYKASSSGGFVASLGETLISCVALWKHVHLNPRLTKTSNRN